MDCGAGALRRERQEQYQGEDSARIGDLRGRSHHDDGTQLNPKRDGYVPQTKAEQGLEEGEGLVSDTQIERFSLSVRLISASVCLGFAAGFGLFVPDSYAYFVFWLIAAGVCLEE